MTEATTQHASNQTEAAAAIGVSDAEWKQLREMPGFPEKTEQGWDLDAIHAWLADATAAQPVGEPTTEPPAENGLPNTGPAELEDLTQPVEVGTITITLPYCRPRDGSYIAKSVCRFNSHLPPGAARKAFQQVHAGIREMNMTDPDGRPYASVNDVIRAIFEEIAAQLTPTEG